MEDRAPLDRVPLLLPWALQGQWGFIMKHTPSCKGEQQRPKVQPQQHTDQPRTPPPDLCRELLAAIISMEPTLCSGSEQCNTTLQVPDVCCEYMQERPPEWCLLTRAQTQSQDSCYKSPGYECKPGALHSCLISTIVQSPRPV